MAKRQTDLRRFWTGGPEEYRNALEKWRAAELAPLESMLEDATDLRKRARLELQIREVNRRYDARRNGIDESLF